MGCRLRRGGQAQRISRSAAICLAYPDAWAPKVGRAPRAKTHPAASALIDRPAPEALTDRSRHNKVERRWIGGSGHQINGKPIHHAFRGDGGQPKAIV